MRMICLCFGRNQDIKGGSVLNVAKMNCHFKSNVRLYVSFKVFPKLQPFNREQQLSGFDERVKVKPRKKTIKACTRQKVKGADGIS